MRSITTFVFIAILVFSSTSVSAQSTVTVWFKDGATSASYNGSIKGSKYIDYRVSARAGQTMTVKLTGRSGEPPYFNVVKRGSDVAIADDARETTEWTGEIPENGAYVVRVLIAKAGRLANRTSNFRVTISIDGGSQSGGVAGASGDSTIYYDCNGSRLRADFKYGDFSSVRIRFGTQDITLPLEQSPTGRKFEIENNLFHVQGKTATLRTKVLDSECRETR